MPPEYVSEFAQAHDAGLCQCEGSGHRLPCHGQSEVGGAQLAIDTTLVSALRGDGSARRHAAFKDGVALLEARKWKVRTYPELVGDAARARLVVLAAEGGGRWSCETLKFLKFVANAKSRSDPAPLRGKERAAWFCRRSALSLRSNQGACVIFAGEETCEGLDGVGPHLHEVPGDSKYAHQRGCSMRR